MSDQFGKISILSPPDAIEPPVTPEKQADSSREKKKRPQKQKKPWVTAALVQKISVFLLFLFIAYSFIGFWGIPTYLRYQLPKKFTADNSLRLYPGTIRFNPFTFIFEADGIRINEISDSHEKTVFESGVLQAKLAPLPFFRSKLVCKSIRVDKPILHITRLSNGQYDFVRLFGQLKAEKSSDILDLAELPFHFSLNNIIITQGKITFADNVRQASHVLDNIEVALPNLSNVPYQIADYINPRFSANFNGSPLELTNKPTNLGSSAKQGKQTELSCSIRDLEIPRYLNYLPVQLPLTIKKGFAEGNLQLSFSPGSNENVLSVDFTFKISDMELSDQDHSVTIQMPTVHLDGKVQPFTGETLFRNIVTHGFTLAAQNQFPWHLAALLASPPPEAKAGEQAAPNAAFYLRIANLLADGGTYILTRSKKNATLDSWENIDVRLNNFSRSVIPDSKGEETGTYSISATQLDSNTRLHVSGTFLDSALSGSSVSFEKLPVSTLFNWLSLQELTGSGGTADMAAVLQLTSPLGSEKSASLYHLEKGSISIQDVTIGPENKPWLAASAMKVGDFSYQDGKSSFGKIEIDKGKINIDTNELPPFFSAGALPDGPIVFGEIHYNGEFIIADSTRKLPELHFHTVTFNARELNQVKRQLDKDNIQIEAFIGDKGHFTGKGSTSLVPFSTALRSGFEHIPAALLLPWYTKNSFIQSLDAVISGKGNFTFPDHSFHGDISIGSSAIRDMKEKKVLCNWDKLDLLGLRFDRDKSTPILSEMHLSKPQFSALMTDKSPALLNQLKLYLKKIFGQTSSDDKSATAPQPLRLDIQKVIFKEGSLALTDTRLTPQLITQFSSLTGTISDVAINKQSKSSIIEFQGLINNSPFTLKGATTLFDASGESQLQLALSNYPLANLEKQLSPQNGIDTRQGSVGLELLINEKDANVVEKIRILGANIIPVSPQAESALTLALLTDADHQIEFETGSTRAAEKPPTSVFTEILLALQKLNVKAGIAPFLVANGSFSDLAAKNGILFIPGQLKIAEDSIAYVSRLQEFLAEHPFVSLELTGGADSTLDAQAIKKQLEEEESARVAQENERRKAAWLDERQKRNDLVNKERIAKGEKPLEPEKNIPTHLLSTYGPVKPLTVAVDQAMLKDLAKQRGEFIQTFLINTFRITPDRIILSANTHVDKGKNEPGYKVYLHPKPFFPGSK